MDEDITLELRQELEDGRERHAPVDARAFQQALDALLKLLRAEASDDVAWQIADLKIGSAICGIAPDRETEAPRRLISNLRHVASGRGLPSGWGRREVTLALELARARNRKPGTVISLASRRSESIAVDDNFEAEAAAILQVKHHSLTSLVGVIDEWSIRRKNPAVGFTTDLGKHIIIEYPEGMKERMREFVDSRVEARCRVGRNGFGDIVAAEMLDCIELPSRLPSPVPEFRSMLGAFTGPGFAETSLDQWLEARGTHE
ncbi:hypothetical protein ACFSDA_08200 [Brachybacterium rhamnosum]|uniref:DUF222 domain-containing protein n=1 Tax=Brachybacterium rhamnosum TaxID=173361 RepID=A0ABW4PZ43_9MICO